MADKRVLARCEVCRGSGQIKGIFHLMECAGCNGGGVIDQATNLPLEYPDLVAEQRNQLDRAQKEIEQLQRRLETPAGPASDYVGQSNKHHHGGGNWTGD
jgi:DnaJ-class molecular chaperone